MCDNTERKNKMSKYTFLYRHDEECAYIELNAIGRFECGHYFASLRISGASWSGKSRFPNYDDVETVLTETEYNRLFTYGEAISELGYGIEKDSARYKLGVTMSESAQNIIDKLNSEENKQFFERIQEDEIRVVQDEWGLSEEEVRYIFDYSPYGYKDRGLISYVWRNAEEMAREYCWSTGVVDNDSFVSNYIDYEEMGRDFLRDFLDEEQYYELDDYRVVQIYV